MHALGRADDRVDGAGIDAQRAAYAAALVDERDPKRRRGTEGSVERDNVASRQRGQHRNRGVAAGGAAVDVRGAAGDRLGVGTTALVSAARALRLRQYGIDTLDQGVHTGIVDEKRVPSEIDEKRVRS